FIKSTPNGNFEDDGIDRNSTVIKMAEDERDAFRRSRNMSLFFELAFKEPQSLIILPIKYYFRCLPLQRRPVMSTREIMYVL
ncbi:hypothetical protein L9F63_015179, partial [Diploptera punctata]